MRHYIKLTRNPGSTQAGTGRSHSNRGVGSNRQDGVIFDMEVLTQAKARSNGDSATLGQIELREKDGVRTLRYIHDGRVTKLAEVTL